LLFSKSSAFASSTLSSRTTKMKWTASSLISRQAVPRRDALFQPPTLGFGSICGRSARRFIVHVNSDDDRRRSATNSAQEQGN
jgi:hypothetical protein